MTQSTRRRRVLIVEDEPALRLSYERAFRPRYDLVFASTGAEALEQLEQQRPDVAVLDMRLPDTDGVELLRRIRLSQPELPVIITTAYMSIEPQLRRNCPSISCSLKIRMHSAALRSLPARPASWR